MADLRIQFDVRLTTGLARWAICALLMLFYAPELGSENVVLTTYYPAPSGIYRQMITTDLTTLARDGSYVKIGTGGLVIGTPDTHVGGAKLTVRGDAHVAGSLAANSYTGNAYLPNYANWNSYGTGAGGAAIYNDSSGYQKLMVVGNSSGGGGLRRVGIWDELTVNGNTIITGSSDASGPVVSRQTSCYDVSIYYAAGAGTTPSICAGGYFVTMADGHMSKRIAMAPRERAVVDASSPYEFMVRCCPCPNYGCPL